MPRTGGADGLLSPGCHPPVNPIRVGGGRLRPPWSRCVRCPRQDNPTVPLRSYVYISKTKVDSLYEQIPPKQLKRLAKKLTIDLKIIKAEFGAEEREESLVARTQIVERYLDHEGVVADVDAAGQDDEIEFFRGPASAHLEGRTLRRTVYFSGRTDDTVLVMAAQDGTWSATRPHTGSTRLSNCGRPRRI